MRRMLIAAWLATLATPAAAYDGDDLDDADLREVDRSRAYLQRVDPAGARLCRTTLPDGAVSDADCAADGDGEVTVNAPS